MLPNNLVLICLFLLVVWPINVMDQEGIECEIIPAMQADDIERVRHLLSVGLHREPNFRVEKLFQSAETARMAAMLIDEYGADVNDTFIQEYGRYINEEFEVDFSMTKIPLHQVQTGQVAELLLACGADVEAFNGWGTPLHTATSEGNIPVTQALLNAGANPNRQNIYGNTPLMLSYYAVMDDDTQKGDLIKLLLLHGADPGIQNCIRNSPMGEAEKYQDFKITRLFKIHRLLKTNKALNTIILLRNRELYGTFHSPY